MGFLSCVMYSNRIRCPLSKISVKAYISEDIVTTRTHALVKHIASPTPASQSFSFNDDKLKRKENSSLSKGLLRCDIVAMYWYWPNIFMFLKYFGFDQSQC